jgi:hypothetical protein
MSLWLTLCLALGFADKQYAVLLLYAVQQVVYANRSSMAAIGIAAAGGRVLGKLVPATSALFVCDVQERFRPLITGYPTVIDTARRMVGRR